MYVPKENGGVVDVQLVNKAELMHVDRFSKCSALNIKETADYCKLVNISHF